MKIYKDLIKMFDDPDRAMSILKGYSTHSKFTDNVVKDLTKIIENAFKKRGALKCILLESEIEALTEPLLGYPACGNSNEDYSIDDRDSDDWESAFDPGRHITDPEY